MESLATESKLLAEIRSLRGEVRVMHTKMFGAEEQEMSQGRLPRLEAAVEDHDQRILRIERITAAGRAIAWLMGVVSGALGGFFYFLRIGGHH